MRQPDASEPLQVFNRNVYITNKKSHIIIDL